jgi:hypothetical protein
MSTKFDFSFTIDLGYNKKAIFFFPLQLTKFHCIIEKSHFKEEGKNFVIKKLSIWFVEVKLSIFQILHRCMWVSSLSFTTHFHQIGLHSHNFQRLKNEYLFFMMKSVREFEDGWYKYLCHVMKQYKLSKVYEVRNGHAINLKFSYLEWKRFECDRFHNFSTSFSFL